MKIKFVKVIVKGEKQVAQNSQISQKIFGPTIDPQTMEKSRTI